MPLLLLLACAHRGPGRLDSGETGETGETGDTAETPILCGPWAGVARVGTRWTYAPTDDYVARWGFDGTFDVVVSALDGDTVTLSQEGAYEGDDSAFSWVRTDVWRCDADGAWWVGSEAANTIRSGTSTSSTEGWRTFTPGWRVRPATFDGPWTDTFTRTMSVNGGEPANTDVTCTSTLSGERRETLGDAELDSRQVTPTCDTIGADPYWLADGVGLVETPDEHLVSYLR